MSLGWKLVWRFVLGLFAFGLLFFLSAGTLRYWQAWAFLGVWFIPSLCFCLYFFGRDPALVQRRLQSKETVKEQKWIMGAVCVIFFAGFLISGLDFRFGWTKKWVGGIPLWLEIVSLAIVLAAYLMVIRVMDVNRYAARTIRVEEGQKVISRGPYRRVLHHPFYSSSMIMLLFAPLALGSLVALPVLALSIPLYVLRLLNEEKVLCRELPGYNEYCEGTRHRLVPYIWWKSWRSRPLTLAKAQSDIVRAHLPVLPGRARIGNGISNRSFQMKGQWKNLLIVVLMCLVAGAAVAQTKKEVPDADVVSKSIKAVGYDVGGGATKVVFLGTTAAPNASGEAKVEAKTAGTSIELKVKGMPQPTTLGAEFLTYVLWTITPEGSTSNLGEIPVDKNGNGKLNATAQSQTFAMIVTAEPYFAVSLPSEVVALENDTKKNTKGKIYPDNSYKLMKRSQYAKLGNPLALTPDLKNVPLDMYEARNAVDIAKAQGAEKYAPEILSKATSSLQMAENALSSKADKSQIITDARQTIQFAEDARALSAQQQEAERIQKEKDAAAAAAAAKAKEEAEAQAAAEAQRQAELNAAKQAQIKAEAEAAAVKARAEADAAAAKAKAEADAQAAALQAREQAAQEEAERAKAQTAALRAQLLQQLNSVLQTTDSPRGLVVNMADVLFAFGKYNLKPDAQIKLAKLAGIIQAHPGLHLAIEGHTDNVGSDETNMKLSQQRADAVRDFLVQQGLSPDALTAVGFGKAEPVADNSTSEGRQKNRRVEIIVSGEVIGAKLG